MSSKKRVSLLLALSILFSSVTPVCMGMGNGVSSATSLAESARQSSTVLPIMGVFATKFVSGAAVSAGILTMFYIFLKFLERDVRRGGNDAQARAEQFVNTTFDRLSQDLVAKLLTTLSNDQSKAKVRDIISNLDDPIVGLLQKVIGEVQTGLNEAVSSVTSDESIGKFKTAIEGIATKMNEEITKTINGAATTLTSNENIGRCNTVIEDIFKKANDDFNKLFNDTVKNLTTGDNMNNVTKAIEDLNKKFDEEMEKTVISTQKKLDKAVDASSFAKALKKENRDKFLEEVNGKLNEEMKKTAKEMQKTLNEAADGILTNATKDENMKKCTRVIKVLSKQVTEDSQKLVEAVINTGVGTVSSDENNKKIEGTVGAVVDKLCERVGSRKNTGQLEKIMLVAKKHGNEFIDGQTGRLEKVIERQTDRLVEKAKQMPGVSTGVNATKYVSDLPGRVSDGVSNIFGGSKKKEEKKKKVREKLNLGNVNGVLDKKVVSLGDFGIGLGKKTEKGKGKKDSKKKKQLENILETNVSGSGNQSKKKKKDLLEKKIK